MKYKLLPYKKKGMLLTRQPEIVKDELSITFLGAPNDATAIFKRKSDKTTIYRQLQDNVYKIPTSFLVGEIAFCVSVLDGKTNPTVFVCEELIATKTGAETLVYPNDKDLSAILIETQLELQKITDTIGILQDNYTELYTKIEDMLEGYDIT